MVNLFSCFTAFITAYCDIFFVRFEEVKALNSNNLIILHFSLRKVRNMEKISLRESNKCLCGCFERKSAKLQGNETRWAYSAIELV